MSALVLQSDFGTADGAVAAMVGVALGVDPDLRIFDLTHHIPPFDVWEASYRLLQTISYWPEGSVFVSVVDPGVGSDRKSAVAKTESGHFVVTPDNGTLTTLLHRGLITEIREIDESVNRLPNSGESYTFHGRDIYAYTAARLASGAIDFAGVGPEYEVADAVRFPVEDPRVVSGQIHGTIDAHDIRYGSLWTNIPRPMMSEIGVDYGTRIHIQVLDRGRLVHENELQYSRSFSEVPMGTALGYVNSLDNLAIAINRGSYAAAYSIGYGQGWSIRVSAGN